MSNDPVVHSFNLSEYKLTKQQLALLVRWREMRDYMLKANRTPPCVRLRRRDYEDIAARISRQSEGHVSIEQVRYEGVPILSASV